MRERFTAGVVLFLFMGFFGAAAVAIISGAMLAWYEATRPTPKAALPEEDWPVVNPTRPAPAPAAPSEPTSVASSPREASSGDARPLGETSEVGCPMPKVTGVDDKLVALRTRSGPPTAPPPPRIEPVEVYPQAEQLARSLEPDASLASIEAPRVVDGGADITAPGQVTFTFEYFRYSRSDAHEEGAVVVTLGCWGLFGRVYRSPRAEPRPARDKVGAPRCLLSRAWATAVASGVSDMLLVTARYQDADPATAGSPAVWTLEVSGQPTTKREVHGVTCALLRTWAGGAPVAAGAPAASGARSDAHPGAASGTKPPPAPPRPTAVSDPFDSP